MLPHPCGSERYLNWTRQHVWACSSKRKLIQIICAGNPKARTAQGLVTKPKHKFLAYGAEAVRWAVGGWRCLRLSSCIPTIDKERTCRIEA